MSTVNSLLDIEESLVATRIEFYKTISPIRPILDQAVSLFFEIMHLIGIVAKDTDDEIYIVEVLLTVFRRVAASYVLLESGLPDEARMQLRNALELHLIATDITYNDASLEEWKNSDTGEGPLEDPGSWYFTPRKICNRLKANEKGVYPDHAIFEAVGRDQDEGNSLWAEWKHISNQIHAHSRAQISKYTREFGTYQLLGRETEAAYSRDIQTYRTLVIAIVRRFAMIPKYQALFKGSIILASRATKFIDELSAVQEEMFAAGTALPIEDSA